MTVAAAAPNPTGPSAKVLAASLFLTLAIIGGVTLAYLYPVSRPAPASVSNPQAKIEAVEKKRLSPEEYKALEAKFITLVNERGPRKALAGLSALMKRDQLVLKECHGLVHVIGRASLDKYGLNRALAVQDDLCGSGYTHGAIERYFRGSKDIYLAMTTACAQYQDGRCYHGVGHGLMYYTNNDLPKSVEYCGTIPSPAFRNRCAEGVYMENFGTLRALHPSKYLDEKRPLYPCSEQPSAYRGVCYYYAPLFYLNRFDEDYKGALAVCRDAGGYSTICTRGVGSRIMKEHIEDPRFSEKGCSSGRSWQFQPCLEGMVSYHLVNYGSVAKALAMCKKLTPAHRSACMTSVYQQQSLAPMST